MMNATIATTINIVNTTNIKKLIYFFRLLVIFTNLFLRILNAQERETDFRFN
jgi:hypothetical protein